MRRAFLILLTLLMFSQSTWAEKAICCLGEAKGAGAVVEQLAAQQQATAGESWSHTQPPAAELKHVCDVGHCHCHHGCGAVITDVAVGLDMGLPALPLRSLTALRKSHIPAGLDRPNWLRA